MQTMDHPDPSRARLREVIGAIEAELGEGRPRRWQDLVDLLALGPEPDLRSCPSCGRRVMLAATRCGFCWEPLPKAP
jgi:hypothetical protein